MPQFDPTTFASQLFWLIVCFTVFFLILRMFVIPRMADVMKRRSDQIEQDLENAERMQAEAKQAFEEYEQALTGSRTEAREILRRTSDEAATASAAALTDKAAELAAKAKEAETRIGKARQDALANIQSVAADVVQAATQQLIGVKVTKSDANSAVAAAAKESR